MIGCCLNRHVEDSFVKMQSEPFDSGAMRQVYRMKKLSQLNLTNWCAVEWTNAPNLVAKCYKNSNNEWNAADRMKCFADVKLQIEAAELAALFNHSNPPPPKQIEVITCFVIEFYDRPGIPVFGCERFIDGQDEFGHGFVKHNSNQGFVDAEEIRQTPQAFSYFSFFASKGDRMVVDVQGVNDLYTDPQIHSIDCRFGNADLGSKGMAYFFANAHRGPLFEYMKIPIFEVSRRTNRRLQDKATSQHQKPGTVTSDTIRDTRMGRRRVNALWHSMGETQQQHVQTDVLNIVMDEEDRAEITESLALAVLVAQQELSHADNSDDRTVADIWVNLVASTSPHISVKQLSHELIHNMGKVHFELAALHIQGQFSTEIGEDGDPLPDIPSCIFHLCRACVFGNVEAALALGKIKQGPLDEVTILTLYLQEFIKIDADTIKVFSQLAHHRMNKQNGKQESAEPEPSKKPAGRHLVRQPSVAPNLVGGDSWTDFCVGDEVEANYKCGGFWYVATIVSIKSPLEVNSQDELEDNDSANNNGAGFSLGKVTVKYDEGTVETLGFEDIKRRRAN
jgi:elongation factor 2 kinase